MDNPKASSSDTSTSLLPSTTTTTLSSLHGALAKSKEHHVGGSPPTSFRNPWASFRSAGLYEIFATRFLRKDKSFVPVPEHRQGLVAVREPDWGASEDSKEKLKATWIGHASWLVESSAVSSNDEVTGARGVRILLDPLFSERTSPFTWIGPKRYTPTPCSIDVLPHVDAIVISHNHYDHLDAATITQIYAKQKQQLHIFCPLGNAHTFHHLGVKKEQITEMDWWDVTRLSVEGIGSVKIICTPAQHVSARGMTDKNKGLWASWCVIEESHEKDGKRLYFGGDTGYRSLPKHNITREEASEHPRCPAFKEIGDLCGPFDLALLPIGLYSPRDMMSSMHCAPEDSACLHIDIRSKRSIGMHYGTVRGGISAQYEDVTEPPKRWKEACEAEGLKWGDEVDLCDIGETVTV